MTLISRFLLSAAALTFSFPVLAQEAPPVTGVGPDEEEETLAAAAQALGTIVITGRQIRGAPDTEIEPEVELDEEDIASYGAGSIEELVEALAPQTGSARGRGGGRPIFLVNGQRVSGFRTLRDLPPEAILRVQVFPEELALQYGYPPDARVVNFILKDDFAQISGEAEYGQPLDGGYSTGELEGTYTRIGESSRINLDVEYSSVSSLTEAERGIVQTTTDSLTDIDEGKYRTLIAASDTIEANGSVQKQLSPRTSLTLSSEYSHTESESLQGLASAQLTVPASSPFTTSSSDQTIVRLFEASGPLRRHTSSDSAGVGSAANGALGAFDWSLTANYDFSERTTVTEREGDTEALEAAVLSGDPSVDPYAADIGTSLAFREETSFSRNQTADLTGTLNGAPLDLPAGPVRTSLTAGYNWFAVDGRSDRNGTVTETDLGRSEIFARANLDLPITSVRDDVLAAIGDVGLNLNAGYSELNDFGGLARYGAGLRWAPTDNFSLLVSFIGEETAPTVSQLGDPIELTPNVTTFDIATGETVAIDRISGGNPDLSAETRGDWKATINWNPLEDVRLLFEYARNHSEDVSSAFPLLTPEIEAAFPDRVTRDAFGQLVSIDARPVTYAEVDAVRIRYGINVRGTIEREQEETDGPRGSRGGPGGPAGGFMPGRGGPSGIRWNIGLYHNWSLDETVLIRPGIPVLDLLGGDVIGGGTPTPRHEVELEGGVFAGGFGMRFNASYTGTARIDGSDLPGSTDLFYGDIMRVDLRLFANLDNQEWLVGAVPALQGGRLSLDIDNLFGGARRVEDETGEVPLNFPPGYLDPQGTLVELSFRKRF